jgi:hypothetical protein
LLEVKSKGKFSIAHPWGKSEYHTHKARIPLSAMNTGFVCLSLFWLFSLSIPF